MEMDFVKRELNRIHLEALVRLMQECDFFNIDVDKVYSYCNGFLVTFPLFPGADAICHDGSYGESEGMWETMGMPWDYDDVSVHTAEELVELMVEYTKHPELFEEEED